MLRAVSLQSQQVALPQAHGPGAVPDCAFMTGQHQVFDLQLAILRGMILKVLVTNDNGSWHEHRLGHGLVLTLAKS